jgi:fructose-1,6-bisphosphatase/inositol monophosphatase family enzyme
MDRYDFCRALARDAGKLAHRAFGTSATTMKGRHDVVTEMDREVERFIRAAIATRFPQDAVIEDATCAEAEFRGVLGLRLPGGAHRAHPERWRAPRAVLRLVQ